MARTKFIKNLDDIKHTKEDTTRLTIVVKTDIKEQFDKYVKKYNVNISKLFNDIVLPTIIEDFKKLEEQEQQK
jgi:hypothetical protein